MKRIDSKTYEVDEGLDLVMDDCGHPYYVIVSTREGDREWTTQAIEKALAREGYQVWCDTSTWQHQRDWSSIQVHEGGYNENGVMRRNGDLIHAESRFSSKAGRHSEGAPFSPRGPRVGKSEWFNADTEVFVTKEPDGLFYLWWDDHNGKVHWTYAFKTEARALRELKSKAGRGEHHENGDVVDRAWRFRKTGYDPTWGPIPKMRTEGPVGKAGTVYEFNVKLHHELIGLDMTDEDFYIESEHAVRALGDSLRESYPWISEVYQTGRSGGWIAIKDAAGKAREKSLREIAEFIQEEKKEFASELKERYGSGQKSMHPNDKIVREVWLCDDCTIVEVNDDPSGIDSDARVKEVYKGLRELKRKGHISSDWDSDTGDGIREFSASRCGACRTTLAGERHRFAQWSTRGASTRSHHANASSYYVWPVTARGEPLAGEGPFGPYPLQNAKTTARIRATNGGHDYAVTHGRDAAKLSFVRLYQAGTGKNLLD